MRISVRKFKTSRLALGLLLSTALTGIVAVSPAIAHVVDQETKFQAYGASNYSSCDVALIAAIWNSSIVETKATIGSKIIGGTDYITREDLVNSRVAGNSCGWDDLPYSYEDAEKIFNLWNFEALPEAKAKMALLATAGHQNWVDAALENPMALAPVSAPTNDSSNSFTDRNREAVYFASRHTYCDAKLVAALWKWDIYDAKLGIGSKIISGNGDMIPELLDSSRSDGNQCEWSDTGYSYEDAETIARVWDRSSVSDAKSKMTMLATAGRQNWVDAALGR